MAGALENKPAAKTILGFGTLLGEDGRPMHKSWGNSIEFNEAADDIGADVMRWMFANQRYDSDMLFGYHGADETRRRFMLPLWNVYSFFVTYANLDHWTPGKTRVVPKRGSLDAWILARLAKVVTQVTDSLEEYYAYQATKPLEEFLDDLSNWYVRRSRRRFWKSQADADKQAAYETLYHVLVTLTKLLAPFVPFVAEEMYQNLVRSVDKRAPKSVHHCLWPKAEKRMVKQSLIDEMAAARTVVALGHAIRSENNLKVRQPLERVVVVAPTKKKALERMSALVTDELNVKALSFAANDAELVTYKLLPDNRALGPKYGALFPKIRESLQRTDPQQAVTALRAGKNLELNVEGKTLALLPSEVLISMQPREGFAVKAEGDVVVALDTKISLELYNEGLAREFVRHVQTLRKEAGLDISDRIIVRYASADSMEQVAEMLRMFSAYVQRETLAIALEAGPLDAELTSKELDLDGKAVQVGVKKAFGKIAHPTKRGVKHKGKTGKAASSRRRKGARSR
jgi:isoleucyl-tRNA synthetase